MSSSGRKRGGKKKLAFSSSSSSPSSSPPPAAAAPGTVLFLCLLSLLAGVYVGLLLASSSSSTPASSGGPRSSSSLAEEDCSEDKIKDRVRVEVKRLLLLAEQQRKEQEPAAAKEGGDASRATSTERRREGAHESAQEGEEPLLPSTVGDYAVGMGLVGRDALIRHFGGGGELGFPFDPSTRTNKEVLIVYHSESSLPDVGGGGDGSSAGRRSDSVVSNYGEDVDLATSNCDYFHLILTDPRRGQKRQCTAMMGQYESFHVQKLVRLPNGEGEEKEGEGRQPRPPLKYVGRGAQATGRQQAKPPKVQMSLDYWNGALIGYLRNLDTALQSLKPVAAKAAQGRNSTSNAIVVLVCNFGQSELLLNFLCSAGRRNLDLSSVVVFAADAETYDLVRAFSPLGDGKGGVQAFPLYEVLNDGFFPKDAARRYGDKKFRAMMMAKVFCVQMTIMLGYNVLFQDVDVSAVVWLEESMYCGVLVVQVMHY